MSGAMPAAVVLPPSQIEELLRSLTKGLRAFQMYLPNNPIYQRAVQNVHAAFQPIWASGLDRLVLQIVETDMIWEEQVVYHQPSKPESLAWSLFKDGMRVLTLLPGVEDGEIVRFLEIVQKARTLSADAGDDLLTLLWEQDFSLIQYHFTEFIPDAAVPSLSGEGAVPATEPEAQEKQAGENRAKVAEEAPARSSKVLDLEDFDATLYWLEEGEIRALNEAIEKEYRQDLRSNILHILFDLVEQRSESSTRSEVLGLLEAYLPHLLNSGDFRSVALILREIRLLVRRPDLFSREERERLDVFTGQLSEAGVLQQILQSVTESQTPPTEDDLGELFRELRPAALETILVWLPKLAPGSPVHQLLTASAERLAETSPQEVLRLLRLPDSEALPAVLGLCGRLRLQPAVAGLGETLGHPQPNVRLLAVQALEQIGTAGALQVLERAVDDADREVRIAGVSALGKRGYKGALERIEAAVQGKLSRAIDITERMRFFDAYAQIAGAGALEPLARMLSAGGLFRRKETAEVRACAARALGRLGSPEAREVLEKYRDDKELVVRTAVNRALREAVQ